MFGDFNIPQRAGLDVNLEIIITDGGLPAKGHFPAVQIAVNIKALGGNALFN